jgi:hypothetical protein
MLKMAKTEEAIELSDEPRSVRDPVKFNRLRIMIEEEAIKPTWGCPLYIAARKGGWLNEDQKRAGDKYQQLTMDYRRLMASDPDDFPVEARPLAYKRLESTKDRYTEALNILGIGRRAVDTLVLHELHLASEKERSMARDGLQLLSNFFELGTKRQHP